MQAAPGESPDSMEWWKKAVIYQIYPRSFQDSNGDGIGDIPGITARLDYLLELGVGAIWLSPFYPSPQLDFGYDISEFCDVEPTYGTLQDFDKLLAECHSRGIRVIVDFVPCHTSDIHSWFQRSVRREDPYTDYYIWHDGKIGPDGTKVPPNKWLSVFGGTAWSWHEERGQFYYRPFMPQQPKLNYWNPAVREEMRKVLTFWLDRGVDGIRVDAFSQIMENKNVLLDEPRSVEFDCPPDEYEYLDHIHTTLQLQSFDLMQSWKDVMDSYEKNDGRARFIIIEVYYAAERRNVLRKHGGIPFNMDLIRDLTSDNLSGSVIRDLVDGEYSNLPEGAWPTFVVGNHDRGRVATRLGLEYVDAFNMLLLTLKGTPTTYYGEELGMEDIDVTFEDTKDYFGLMMGPNCYLTFSRDPCRSPMQWDNSSSNAGFTSSNRPWLPIHHNWKRVNVEFQSREGQASSLRLYQALAKLRQSPAFLCGDLLYAYSDQEIFSYIRQHKPSGERYLVTLNFGKKQCSVDLTSDHVNVKEAKVVLVTPNTKDSLKVGHVIQLNGVTLKPGDGVVTRLDL